MKTNWAELTLQEKKAGMCFPFSSHILLYPSELARVHHLCYRGDSRRKDEADRGMVERG